jgi:polysaccharide export outer membrane protein
MMMAKNMRIVFVFALALFLSAYLSACAGSGPAVREVETPADYTLGISDKVTITVYGHDDLSGDFSVEPSGIISFPLLRDVPASGLSARELEVSITQALSKGYIIDPRVSVELSEFRKIYVLGEVQSPGQYEYIPNMTLLQAIAVAGGYTYRASENRGDITRHVKGAIKTFSVDNKTMLKPGDTIVINRRWF